MAVTTPWAWRPRRSVRVLCAAAGLCLVAAATALAQDETTLTVSSTAADAGAEARTPIYLSSGSTIQPGALTITLSYPSDLLTFKAAESDFSEAMGFTIGTTVRAQDDGKTTAVDLDVRYPKPDKTKTLPDGPIVRVFFNVSKTAKQNSKITLHASAVMMTSDTPPKPVKSVKAYDGTIDVTGANIFSCFFYMH